MAVATGGRGEPIVSSADRLVDLAACTTCCQAPSLPLKPLGAPGWLAFALTLTFLIDGAALALSSPSDRLLRPPRT